MPCLSISLATILGSIICLSPNSLLTSHNTHEKLNGNVLRKYKKIELL
jgi:hypothetical protein